MNNDINNNLNMIIDKLEKYSDDYKYLKNVFINDNVIELAEDSIQILGIISKSVKFVSEKKFQWFLKGLSLETVTEYQIKKLYTYIEKTERADAIADIFRKVYIAQSKISCCLIGIIVSDIISQGREFDQLDVVLCNALENLTDYDLKNYWNILRSINNLIPEYMFTDEDLVKAINKCEYDVSIEMMHLTLRVLEKNNLIQKSFSGSFHLDADGNLFYEEKEFDCHFMISYTSLYMLKIMERVKILFEKS